MRKETINTKKILEKLREERLIQAAANKAQVTRKGLVESLDGTYKSKNFEIIDAALDVLEEFKNRLEERVRRARSVT